MGLAPVPYSLLNTTFQRIKPWVWPVPQRLRPFHPGFGFVVVTAVLEETGASFPGFLHCFHGVVHGVEEIEEGKAPHLDAYRILKEGLIHDFTV